ncbi:MAG: DUF4389 domain-containing protein [Candidatus Zixiibacteriota bacterium]
MTDKFDQFGHPIGEDGERCEQEDQKGQSTYPVDLKIDYPGELDRISTFFRLIIAIPILIILALLMNSGTSEHEPYIITGIGFVVIPTILTIVFVNKYPKWWYNWNFELMKFSLRVGTFINLMTDKYPDLENDQNVHLTMPYPEVGKDIDRFMPLIKWFLAIPHYIVLIFLGIIAFFMIVISWFAIIFTGKYPRSFFNFIEGYMRWSIRVTAYTTLMITDEYPPFSLNE